MDLFILWIPLETWKSTLWPSPIPSSRRAVSRSTKPAICSESFLDYHLSIFSQPNLPVLTSPIGFYMPSKAFSWGSEQPVPVHLKCSEIIGFKYRLHLVTERRPEPGYFLGIYHKVIVKKSTSQSAGGPMKLIDLSISCCHREQKAGVKREI